MDANSPLSAKNTASVATSHIQSLKLKLNQQLNVKVISSAIDTQTLTLQLTQAKKSVQVQSNLPLEATPGQTLKVLVTKLSPVAEFKVISTDTGKPIDLTKLTLKQIILQASNVKTTTNITNLPASKTSIINAKIISIIDDKVVLKLSGISTAEVIDSALKKTVQSQGSIIQLNGKQLSQKQLPGDTIQLQVLKKGAQLDYKILDPKTIDLKIGQTLTGTVINVKSQSVQIKFPSYSQAITLNKNQISTFKSTLDTVKKDQQINLEVIKTGARAEFKLVTKQTNSEQFIQQIFKQNLPNQQQPAVLLNQIIEQLPNINKSTNIPDTLKRLAKEILDSLDKKSIQQPSQLKKAISNSGLFLEAKLAKSDLQHNLNFQTDFKNKLFKFNQAIKHSLSAEQKLSTNEINVIKELQQKSENSLAKVILNQLASLPKEDSSRQVWILDLPFLNKETAESVEIKITQERQNKEADNTQNWAVTITISPPGLGTIHCNVSCYDKTINTIFWSETDSIVSKIDQNLDYLQAQFDAAGIETGHMSAQTGTPPSNTHQPTSHQDSHLVNQKV